MRKTVLGLLIIAMLALAACSAPTPTTNEAPQVQEEQAAAQAAPESELAEETVADTQNDDSIEDIPSSDTTPTTNTQPTTDTSDSAGYQGRVLAGTSTPLIEFNEADYNKAVAEGKTVLLNFYATWCPSCNKEIGESADYFNNIEGENLVAFQVNYRDQDTDTFETSLAREHGVATQGTKVLIQNGERVFKIPTHWSTAQYEENLAEYI